MARRRPLLVLACVSALSACMQPYSTPKPFEVESGGQSLDDASGTSTTTTSTTAPAETTEALPMSTGAAAETTGTSTTGDATTGTSTSGTSTTDTSTGTTAPDTTTTGDPHDECISLFEPGDECGECLCDKCLAAQMACAADEGCTEIRKCADFWGCNGILCDGPCSDILNKYGGVYGPSGLLSIELGKCRSFDCPIYCD